MPSTLVVTSTIDQLGDEFLDTVKKGGQIAIYPDSRVQVD